MVFGYIGLNGGNMKRIGSSKITKPMRIQLIKSVADILNAHEGDFIDFYQLKSGYILIKKA